MRLYNMDEKTQIDEYGVDHSKFSLQDEIQYNFRRAREKEQQQCLQPQTQIQQETPNSGQQLQMPAGSEQQLVMPSYEVQQQLDQSRTSTWDKIKDWAHHTGDAMQAAAVGYTTGATLGNFDEAMGAATALTTGNSHNYAVGRDATRQLQNRLKDNYPKLYNGAEIAGATTTSGRIPSYLMPFATGTGYADTSNDIFNNIMKNIYTSIATRGIQNIPNVPQFYRNLGQNALSWSLLDQENQQKQ